MSSLRSRKEIRESLAREEKPLQRVASDSPNLRHRNPELRGGIVEDAPPAPEYSVPWAPNFKMSKAEYDRSMMLEAQRQEAARQVTERQQQAQAQKLAAEKAKESFNREAIAGLIANLTLKQVDAVEAIVRQRFPGQENDAEAWQFVLDELRGQENIEAAARQNFMKMKITTIDAASDEDLATFLNCAVSFAARLRADM